MTIYKLHNVLTEAHDWCNLYMGLSIKEGYQKKRILIDGALLSVKPIRIRKVYVFLSMSMFNCYTWRYFAMYCRCVALYISYIIKCGHVEFCRVLICVFFSMCFCCFVVVCLFFCWFMFGSGWGSGGDGDGCQSWPKSQSEGVATFQT